MVPKIVKRTGTLNRHLRVCKECVTIAVKEKLTTVQCRKMRPSGFNYSKADENLLIEPLQNRIDTTYLPPAPNTL